MEGLSIAAQLVDSKAADYVLAATSSHNASAEKQFRYPTEYGRKTAHGPVDGDRCRRCPGGQGRRGPGYMRHHRPGGGHGHFRPLQHGRGHGTRSGGYHTGPLQGPERDPTYYDVIATGDLGRVGYEIAGELLNKHGMDITEDRFTDCGIMIYKEYQPVMAGASGCGCSATVTYGHFLRRMREGELKRILIVATGALMSPMSYQQKESIPCIAHAVSIEM